MCYSINKEDKIQISGDLVDATKELCFTIKILDDGLMGKGLGREAFTLIINYFGLGKIDTICGSWNKDEEFSFFEDGMSTNLKVFISNLDKMNPEEAALSTPTGKWASSFGYTNANVIINTENEVRVNFTK